jgi:hypothetical protein
MALFEFGKMDPQLGYRILNEREVRGSSGITMLVGMIASINGFILKRYDVLPYMIGFIMINFLIGILINPKLMPTMILSRFLVRKQTPLPIGAIQKRFAWSLGFTLSLAIFIQTFFLINDPTFFNRVCMLCVICILFLYLESVFGICVGCKIYYGLIKAKVLKAPEIHPNCMGDACEVPTEKKKEN